MPVVKHEGAPISGANLPKSMVTPSTLTPVTGVTLLGPAAVAAADGAATIAGAGLLEGALR